MSEEKPPEAMERYSTKLIKHAARSTWHFSRQQIIFSSILGLLAAPISVYFGLAPSIVAGVLAVLCVTLVALVGTAVYNVIFHAPVQIYREQQEEIAALKRGTVAQHLPLPRVHPEARPHIVCTTAGFVQVQMDDNDIVRRGWTHIAMVAQFTNEPRTDRHIASEDYVMARIKYFDADGSLCQRVSHGSWVEEEWRWVEFDVGDTRHLVLAVQLTDEDDLNPELTALCAIVNNHEDPHKYNVPDYPHLPPTVSRAEVQLFSGENGAIIGQFTFQFSFGEESRVTVTDPPGQSEKAATPSVSE